MAPTYRDHDSSETVDSVDGMTVMGAHVMVGHYPDGSCELGITAPYPIHPEDADHAFTHGSLPDRLLPDQH